MRLAAHRRRSERGTALVDFVLVMMLIVPLFFGVLQVALVLHVRSTLASAASEGARLAATADRGPGEGVARTRQQLATALGGGFATSVTPRPTTIDGAPAVEIVVHAEVPALGLGGPAVTFDVTASAIEEEP